MQAEIVNAELSAVTHDLSASLAHYPKAQRMLARTRRLSPQQAEAFVERPIALTDEFWPADAPGDGSDETHGYVFAAFIVRNPRDTSPDDHE